MQGKHITSLTFLFFVQKQKKQLQKKSPTIFVNLIPVTHQNKLGQRLSCGMLMGRS